MREDPGYNFDSRESTRTEYRGPVKWKGNKGDGEEGRSRSKWRVDPQTLGAHGPTTGFRAEVELL